MEFEWLPDDDHECIRPQCKCSRKGQWVIELWHGIRVTVSSWDVNGDVAARKVAELIQGLSGAEVASL